MHTVFTQVHIATFGGHEKTKYNEKKSECHMLKTNDLVPQVELLSRHSRGGRGRAELRE